MLEALGSVMSCKYSEGWADSALTAGWADSDLYEASFLVPFHMEGHPRDTVVIRRHEASYDDFDFDFDFHSVRASAVRAQLRTGVYTPSPHPHRPSGNIGPQAKHNRVGCGERPH